MEILGLIETHLSGQDASEWNYNIEIDPKSIIEWVLQAAWHSTLTLLPDKYSFFNE